MKDTFRMYGLVNYQLTGIQKGIQFGHAVVEYGLDYKGNKDYLEWVTECKTFIILNGGTTNKNPNTLGTLNKHVHTLQEMGVKFSCFYEPDLGDQLTSVVFLVPEQVYNKTLYPDYKYVEKSGQYQPLYDDYVRTMGGEKNVKLREFLKDFRLA